MKASGNEWCRLPKSKIFGSPAGAVEGGQVSPHGEAPVCF